MMIRFQRLFFCVCVRFNRVIFRLLSSHFSIARYLFFLTLQRIFLDGLAVFHILVFHSFFFVMFAPYLSVAVLTDSLLKTMFALLCPVFVVYVYASLSLPSRKL